MLRRLLPLVLPIMVLLLTSCSSMGSMQAVTPQAPMVTAKHVKPISVVKPVKSTKPVKHRQVVIKHKHKPSVIPNKSQVLVKPSTHTKTKIEQIEIVVPKKEQKQPTTVIFYPNPVVGELWLLPVHGMDVQPHLYHRLHKEHLLAHINRRNVIGGNYHYIQVVRWDGAHLDQAYVNANTAALLSILGLDMLENGYMQTNLGTTIMIFAGKGFIIDMPVNDYDMPGKTAKEKVYKTKVVEPVVAPASKIKSAPEAKPAPVVKSAPVMKSSAPGQAPTNKKPDTKKPEINGQDFYIMGTEHITVTSNPEQFNASYPELKLANESTNELDIY